VISTSKLVYETGVRVPLIVKFPKNRDAGSTDERLFSFIDLAPTVLSIAGIEPPKVMQGTAHFGKYLESVQREYLFFTSDRFDEVYDRLRGVRWANFKYIRNFNPEISNALPVSYREQMPLMQSLMELRQNGKLDSVQALWFRTPKPGEELYDISKDPLELNNLAGEEEHEKTLLELRGVLDDWMEETRDLGRYPETELTALWLSNGEQPRLPPLELEDKSDSITLHSNIHDATLLWRKQGSDVWEFYREPIPSSQPFSAKSTRIGYQDSPELHIDAK
jgi:arylsulfatase A-like enzyme